MIMQPSEIIVSKQEQTPTEDPHNVKLRQAYLRERKNLEHLDIELNRSRIVVVDQSGKILRLGFNLEH